MIDIQQLTSLISAFRVETEKSAIKWEQCQTCLSIAESRPRSMSINAIKFTWIAEAPPELAVWLKSRCKGTAIFSSPQYHWYVIRIPHLWYIAIKCREMIQKLARIEARKSIFSLTFSVYQRNSPGRKCCLQVGTLVLRRTISRLPRRQSQWLGRPPCRCSKGWDKLRKHIGFSLWRS